MQHGNQLMTWFTWVIATLGRECREWTEKAINLEIDSLVEKK